MVAVLKPANFFEDHIAVKAEFLAQGCVCDENNKTVSAVDFLRFATIGVGFPHDKLPI